MKKVKIIVTRRWPAVVEKELASISEDTVFNRADLPMTKSELIQAMQSAECVLPTVTDSIDAEVLSCENRQCKFLGNFGVGFNHINVEKAKELGILVTNTPEVLTECTSDVALALMLMVARRAGEGERLVRTRSWHGWHPTHMLGHKVTGKTLGLVGFGRIARSVAHRAHFGFDMNIAFFTPEHISKQDMDHFQATRYDDLDQMLAAVDFVSIHCPGGHATHHLFNEDRFDKMQKHAFLINTARGDVVDAEALLGALKSDRIAGAGLDVYESEPNVPEEFLSLDNVVLFPHLGSASSETRIAMGRRVLMNLTAYLSAETLRDCVV